MTHKRTWQKLESKAAKVLGGSRIGCTGLSTPDVDHTRFEIECKYRAALAFVPWLKQAEKHSKKSGKIPLLICKQKQTHGEYVILKLQDFVRLIDGTDLI